MPDDEYDYKEDENISDEDYERAQREEAQREEERDEEEMCDPYSDDEKDQMGSSEFFKDND